MGARLLERERDRPIEHRRDVMACAEVLGAFGVGPTDIAEIDRASTTREDRASTSLEECLASALRDARDRTAFVRQTITRSSRGFTCSGRYADAVLEDELTRVLESLGWSIEWTRARAGFTITATDGNGTSRTATIEYPETPLGSDNLPAVLEALNRDLFDGIDARFVLLSSGVDRWRAALIETADLEEIREAYGDRIEAFDRPLLPADDIDAYLSTEGAAPWPEWATERTSQPANRGRIEADQGRSVRDDSTPSDSVAFIEEAEPGSSDPAEDTLEGRSSECQATTLSSDVLEVVGGSPSVTRVGRDGAAGRGDDPTASDEFGESDAPAESTDPVESDADPRNATRHFDRSVSSRRRERKEGDDGFGTLSGSVQTTTVSNESFGAGVEPETEDDRYRALGAALGSGKNISVKGLLDDEDFLPELPAAEPEEVRLTFEESFDPAAVPKAKAAAEQSGFEWVDAGSVQTTRVPSR